jgi:hypothetical protein
LEEVKQFNKQQYQEACLVKNRRQLQEACLVDKQRHRQHLEQEDCLEHLKQQHLQEEAYLALNLLQLVEVAYLEHLKQQHL